MDGLWGLQNTMLLGQQAGYNKYPCFLCLWDRRAREQHWSKSDWPSRETLKPGEKNVINTNLVSPEKVLLSPLHIKLGLMKQFVKSHQTDGSKIRKLLTDTFFVESMNEKEKEAWVSFKDVV